jgi:hypothetical protein
VEPPQSVQQRPGGVGDLGQASGVGLVRAEQQRDAAGQLDPEDRYGLASVRGCGWARGA